MTNAKFFEIKYKEIFEEHLNENDCFHSLSQFRSSLFEIIVEPKTKKYPDILLHRMLMITNFKSDNLPEPPLSKKLFILILLLFYDKEEYETLKSIVYNSMRINKKYYGIEENDAAKLLASGYVNHPILLRDDKYKDISFCLCTHSIKYHYIVENDIEERCWVGSTCIFNFIAIYNPEMKKTLKELQLKAKHRDEGKICYWCEEPLGNLKEQYTRKGYCNIICHKKDNYKMPFGKCKGELLKEIIQRKKGYEYIEWCMEKYMNNRWFENYPFFIKLIFDEYEFLEE